MARLNKTIGYVVTQRGNFIRDDPAILLSIATVIENNLGMTATITRVSRSYSIGLRNCDLEVGHRRYRNSCSVFHVLVGMDALLCYEEGTRVADNAKRPNQRCHTS